MTESQEGFAANSLPLSLPLDVHHRIDLSCQRFLGFGVGLAGEIPLDEEIVVASRKRELACLKSPHCPAAQSIEQLAAAVTAMPASLASA